MVTGVDVALQGFSLCELGEHFREVARRLRGRLPAVTVIALGELQGKIPEGLHGVGAMVASQARHLHEEDNETSGTRETRDRSSKPTLLPCTRRVTVTVWK